MSSSLSRIHSPNADQHRGDQERDPPAPGLELFVGQRRGQHGQGGVGQQVAGGWPDLRGRRPEAALLGVAVLAGQQHRAAPFAADADALGEPQDDQRDRREHPDGGVPGQQPDQHGRDADQHQRADQDVLATQLVAEPAEEDAADRAGEEPDGVGGERQQRAGEWVAVREEQLREDQRGGRGVDREVVVLERGAGEAGRVGLDQRAAADLLLVRLDACHCAGRCRSWDGSCREGGKCGTIRGAAIWCCAALVRRPTGGTPGEVQAVGSSRKRSRWPGLACAARSMSLSRTTAMTGYPPVTG